MEVQGNPLRNMVEVLEQLQNTIRSSENPILDLQLVARACHFGAQFLDSLADGVFKFGARELQDKANDVEEAARKYITMEAMLDYEISNDMARQNNSHTRFHLRAKRAGDILRVFFQRILAREGNSLLPPFREAYDQVFGEYHAVNVRNAVYNTMDGLTIDKPELFYLIDNDGDAKARELMKRYISVSACLCQHIEHVYRSTTVGQELLGMI